MHEAGHYSLTGDIKTDRTIQTITYGLGCGMSASYWRNQHNKHHASPQKINHDVDLDTLPLVAFHKNIKHKIILKMSYWDLKSVGLSRQKIKYLINIASAFISKSFDVSKLDLSCDPSV